MPFFITCSRCGHAKEVPDSFKGQRVKCPKCGQTFPVASPQTRPVTKAGVRSPPRSELRNDYGREQVGNLKTDAGPGATAPLPWYKRDAAIVAMGIGLILLIGGTIPLALAVKRFRGEAQGAAQEQAQCRSVALSAQRRAVPHMLSQASFYLALFGSRSRRNK
jgi:hypothetical protein